MRTLLKITKTELSVLFYSPIAWLILIVFAFQMGMAYCNGFYEELRYQSLGYSPFSLTSELLGGYGGVFATMLQNLYLYIPLLTMGLMSREFSSGSIKLLYSSPISNIQIILGKYLSTLVYGLILIALLLIPFVFSAITFKDFDYGLALSALLGVYLVICAYSAIGLFMSTVTHYQVVAVIGTMAILAILNFIGGVGQGIAFVREITFWLSISGRSSIFMDGLICSQDILYFLLVVFLFISLSVLKLQGERMKRSLGRSILKYCSVITLVLLCGYISTIPTLIYYYDATATESNTLTKSSRDIVDKLDGDLTITTYVNLLDKNYSRGMPYNRMMDLEKFANYIRFKPEIKFDYVYYYANANYATLEKRFPGASDKQKMISICKINDFDTTMFKSVDQIDENLEQEGNNFIRVIKSENGNKAFLRIYEDQQRDPSETEITVALKTLSCKSPMVGFVVGHNERSISDVGEKGYRAFAKERTFRYSLINQGFKVTEINLDSQVPEDIDIMVLSDMRESLTQEQEINLDNFIARGGNLIIAGESKRQKFINPIVEKLGVKFADGMLVQPTKEYSPDIVVAEFAPTATKCSEELSTYVAKKSKITMPSVCALEYSKDKGFDVVEVLITKSKGVWIELEEMGEMDQLPVLNDSIGEVEKSYPVMLHLTRKVGQKEQRIFILGDADCMSTMELNKRRTGIKSSNFLLITELFRNLSYEEYPIKTSRVRPPDDEIYFPLQSVIWIKIILMGLVPIGLVIVTIMLLAKRKRK